MAVLEYINCLPSTSLGTISTISNPRIRYHRQRKAHHKVKTGCKACKARRQKCDEGKPVCSGCSRHSTECQYQIPERHRIQQPTFHSAESTTRNSTSSTLSVKSLPITPSPDLNLGDLELLHQFLTSTCIAPSQTPEMTAHCHSTMLPLAQDYPFVMRGMLAMAATHLSRLRPSRREHYAMVAARNHHDALPAFQSALEEMNVQNCHALIFYAKCLLWCSLASDASCSDTKVAVAAGNNWLPPWFRLLRGSCQVVESSRPWITDGPHRLYELDGTVNGVRISDEHHIAVLMSRLLPLTAESTLCASVLAALREAFVRAAMLDQSTPVRNGINFWIGSLPDDFFKLLYAKEPWALVTLAHFCVLFHRFETLWFMKGHATQLLLLIAGYLDEEWKCFLQWPCEELTITNL